MDRGILKSAAISAVIIGVCYIIWISLSDPNDIAYWSVPLWIKSSIEGCTNYDAPVFVFFFFAGGFLSGLLLPPFKRADVPWNILLFISVAALLFLVISIPFSVVYAEHHRSISCAQYLSPYLANAHPEDGASSLASNLTLVLASTIMGWIFGTSCYQIRKKLPFQLFVAGAVLLFFCLWQLGIFNPPTACLPKGWVVLQPLSPSLSYHSVNQNFTASFNNAVGTSIRITALNVTEILGPAICADTLGGVGAATTFINGVAFDRKKPAIVASDSAFSISVLCVYPLGDYPVTTRARDDPYEIIVDVSYESVIGGIVAPHEEIGTIRGTVE